MGIPIIRRLTVCIGIVVTVPGSVSAAPRELEAPAVLSRQPAWSPNGKQIAFASNLSAPTQLDDIYVMNSDGTNVRRLTVDEEGEGNPTWSADGRRLAFHSYSHVDVIRSNGTGRRVLAADACCPDWSPAQPSIAFAWSNETTGARIYTVNPNTRRVRLVARPRSSTESFSTPAWSPRGRDIAFSISGAPDAGPVRTYLGIVDVAGTRPIRRYLSGRKVSEPDWSPDGKKIAFTDGLRYVSIVDLRTRAVKRLHRGQSPSWSPDGKRLAFASDGGIYVMRADGTGVRRLK